MWPVWLAAAIVAAALALFLASRRGWHKWALQHRLLTSGVLAIALAVGIPAGWYTISPLFERETICEASPIAGAGAGSEKCAGVAIAAARSSTTATSAATAAPAATPAATAAPAATPATTEAPPALCHALGVQPLFTGKNQFDYLVEVASEGEVRALKPDFGLLATLPVRGVMVTSPASTPGFDFVSRFFGPGAGINEDPVTGSAHCCLGPFWAERLGRKELLAYQASARGGVVRVTAAGDRVLLGGQAVTVMKAELRAYFTEG